MKWFLTPFFLLAQVPAPGPFMQGMALAPENDMTATQPIDPTLQPFVDTAVSDLAMRLSIDRSAIEVVSAQSVVWPDRSLGCPQPGLAYLQVQADGYRIELRVTGKVYSYHGGEGRGPFLCEHRPK